MFMFSLKNMPCVMTPTFVPVRNILGCDDFQIFLQKRREFQVRQCFCSSYEAFLPSGKKYIQILFQGIVSQDNIKERQRKDKNKLCTGVV